MPNPILQALSQNNTQPNIFGLISSLKNGNPNAMFNQLMQSNPQFANFVNSNKGKSVEQIAKENGIDMNTLKMFMR